MRGRTKLLSLAVAFSIMLLMSAVYASGIVSVSTFSFLAGLPVEPNAITGSVFVDPLNTVDSTKQPPSTVTIHINITGESDLFTWQLNITYNKDILNINRLIAGDFLGATKDTSSEVLGSVINVTDNGNGYASFSETVLGDVAGVGGNGRLVSIEFLVVGYGSTDVVISLTGALATVLIDSAGVAVTPSKTDGYFRNKYPGDVNGDKLIGSGDFSLLAASYGSIQGQPAYNKECDFNVDGLVGSGDFSVLAANYGQSYP